MQKHASLPDLAGVAAVVLAVRPGWWREKHPWFGCAGGGSGNAHVLRRVGRARPKTAVALGGNAGLGPHNGLAKWA